MSRWLLAAEADKIQDFVFRAAHLREVMGGSALLTRFCQEEAPKLAAAHGGNELVSDGGSFTFAFDDECKAQEFGRALAQRYRCLSGGTLTVAAPQKWDGADATFATANDAAHHQLARAKRAGRAVSAHAHLPYVAFCASCGIELAETHDRLHGGSVPGERANYLCPSCRRKADEVREEVNILSGFKRRVVGEALAKEFHFAQDADKAAQGWDPRRYVAYLLADGNGMGKIFGQCDRQQMVDLSTGLPDVMEQSLAEPTKLLMKQSPRGKEREIPTMPLILGGDDVFALLPAPYALDFARRFCQAYEKGMTDLLNRIKIPAKPTISVAVVICKSKHPFALAHRHGAGLLKAAKRLAKRAALPYQNQTRSASVTHSVVHGDLVVGNIQSGDGTEGMASATYRASLRPYWVPSMGETTPDGLGLSLDLLIEQRLALAALPSRRLAQLEALYASETLAALGKASPRENEALGRWIARLNQVIARVARNETQATALKAALTKLGHSGAELGYWREIGHMAHGEEGFYGHGLPDLLQLWDFSLDMKESREKYDPEEAR